MRTYELVVRGVDNQEARTQLFRESITVRGRQERASGPGGRQQRLTNYSSSLIVSYFFAFLLFWAPLCLVVGAKKYFFGALYKTRCAFQTFFILRHHFHEGDI